MIIYIISGLICIISYIVWGTSSSEVFLGFGVVVFIISIITQVIYYHSQCDDLETLEELKETKDIYGRQAVELLGEFKTYLLEIYPEIEKNIFENMKPENVSAYMIKYPEIQSAHTIVKLVNLINVKKSQIYKQELKAASIKKLIRIRKRTQKFWVLPILLPKE